MDNPTGRTCEDQRRDALVARVYAAERRAGTDAVTAMKIAAGYSQRIDAIEAGRAS